MTTLSRLAPTPSGYLHLGNAYNFLLTWALVKAEGGKLHLRIDDHDSSRARDEFLDDIFHSLEWLGIDWSSGPTGVEDFKKNHSQTLKTNLYRRFLATLNNTYPCQCSRKEVLTLSPDGIYPRTCYKKVSLSQPELSQRIYVPDKLTYYWNERPISLAALMGDFILWRKDDLPSYQLVSLYEDLELGTNLIVRGEDLLPSSVAQTYLSSQLSPTDQSYSQVDYIHHPLLKGADGEKLAKSLGSTSLKELRKSGVSVTSIYQEMARFFGAKENQFNRIQSRDDLVQTVQMLMPARAKMRLT